MYFWSHFPDHLLEVVLAGLVLGEEDILFTLGRKYTCWGFFLKLAYLALCDPYLKLIAIILIEFGCNKNSHYKEVSFYFFENIYPSVSDDRANKVASHAYKPMSYIHLNKCYS